MSTGKKKKKGNYGKVLGFCGVVACAALLFAWLGGSGFGFGGGGGFGLPFGGSGNNGNGGGYGDGTNGGYTSYPPSDYTPPNGTNGGGENGESGENGADEDVELVIRVVNNRIYHGENEITLDELVPLLEELNQPGAIWELRDEQAIMETYELVRAIMHENEILFAEG